MLVILLANPLTYGLRESLGGFPPDTVKYVSLARNLSSGFQLFLASFGHIDDGIILPPLYPMLIALGSALTERTLAVSEYVSNLSLVLAALPLYALAVRASSRVTAVTVVLALQVTAFHYETGLTPLTEAVFILCCAIGLLALERTKTAALNIVFFAGVLAALVPLARQIGYLFILFGAIAMIFRLVRNGLSRRRGRDMLAWILGCATLLVPYSALVYAQTGSLPLTQSFRRGVYQVPASASEQAEIARIEAVVSQDYGEQYRLRRTMRRLNSDATEMYAFLLRDVPVEDPIARLFSTLFRPAEFARRVANNVGHIRTYLGNSLSAMLVLGMVLPLIHFRRFKFRMQPTIVWGWVLFYIAGLSLMTGALNRYVVVILPFAMIQIASALHRLSLIVQLKRMPALEKWTQRSIPPVLLALGVAFSPALFFDLSLQDKISERELPLDSMRSAVTAGEPVFSLFPIESYLVGGAFRILPNDSLERVAAYGRRTGVRWILIRKDRYAWGESALYTGAPWYRDLGLDVRSDLPVRLCCASPDGSMLLYEILP
jgi:hypothetical protein